MPRSARLVLAWCVALVLFGSAAPAFAGPLYQRPSDLGECLNQGAFYGCFPSQVVTKTITMTTPGHLTVIWEGAGGTLVMGGTSLDCSAIAISACQLGGHFGAGPVVVQFTVDPVNYRGWAIPGGGAGFLYFSIVPDAAPTPTPDGSGCPYVSEPVTGLSNFNFCGSTDTPRSSAVPPSWYGGYGAGSSLGSTPRACAFDTGVYAYCTYASVKQDFTVSVGGTFALLWQGTADDGGQYLVQVGAGGTYTAGTSITGACGASGGSCGGAAWTVAPGTTYTMEVGFHQDYDGAVRFWSANFYPDSGTATAVAGATATQGAIDQATVIAQASATQAPRDTATAAAQATLTQAPIATATAAAQQTATSVAQATATAVAQATGTAVAAATQTSVQATLTAAPAATQTAAARLTQTAAPIATATAAAQQTATAGAQQTATAAARATSTAVAALTATEAARPTAIHPSATPFPQCWGDASCATGTPISTPVPGAPTSTPSLDPLCWDCLGPLASPSPSSSPSSLDSPTPEASPWPWPTATVVVSGTAISANCDFICQCIHAAADEMRRGLDHINTTLISMTSVLRNDVSGGIDDAIVPQSAPADLAPVTTAVEAKIPDLRSSLNTIGSVPTASCSPFTVALGTSFGVSLPNVTVDFCAIPYHTLARDLQLVGLVVYYLWGLVHLAIDAFRSS